MSSLSDYLALGGSGAVKTAYYTTSGSKVLVPHGGKDKLVYIVRGENDGYWVRADGEALYERDVVKVTADFSVDVGVSADPVGTVQGSFASPAGDPRGCCFDVTEDLVSCDGSSDTIYRHQGFSSTISASFASPSASPSDVTMDTDEQNLISCDASTDTIYVHDGVSSTIINSFPSPGGQPNGVAYDPKSKSLVSASLVEGKLYVHQGVSSTVLRSFDTPGPIPRAIGVVNGNLLSCDSFDHKVRLHQGITSLILASLETPGTGPRAVAVRPSSGEIVSSDMNTDLIYTLTGPSQRPYAAIRYITQEI